MPPPKTVRCCTVEPRGMRESTASVWSEVCRVFPGPPRGPRGSDSTVEIFSPEGGEMRGSELWQPEPQLALAADELGDL